VKLKVIRPSAGLIMVGQKARGKNGREEGRKPHIGNESVPKIIINDGNFFS